MSSRRRRRSGSRRARIGLRRPRPRVLAAILAVLALLGGAWLWVRHSSLVAVKRVTVAGATGPDSAQIRSALIAAARDMTTLDVQVSQLRTAVSPYPVVKGLRVTTQFPHGMRIRVIEQVPVATIDVDGRSTAVAADGTLLRDVTVAGSLPSIVLSVAPGGTRVTGETRAELRMLAAAPPELLTKVGQASSDPTHGLIAQLRDGPRVYFGSGAELAAKWRAAVAVLATPSSSGAVYIDVTDPGRPAAGPGSDEPGVSRAPSGGQPASNQTGPAGGDAAGETSTNG